MDILFTGELYKLKYNLLASHSTVCLHATCMNLITGHEISTGAPVVQVSANLQSHRAARHGRETVFVTSRAR